jgi:lysylphosphatidylglycerol synthetase-like protein (DUF2156 family)
LGVTILVFLEILVGIIDIVLGLLLVALYAVAASIFGMGLASAFGFFLVPLIVLFFFFGFLSFVLAYGLWTGQRWAWVIAIILAIIGLATSLIGLVFGSYLNIIPIIFYALILVYLGTYNVRAFFGRAGAFYAPPPFMPPPPYPAPAYMPPVQSQYAPPPQETAVPYYPQPPPNVYPRQPWRRTTVCPRCLSSVALGAPQCYRCGARLT